MVEKGVVENLRLPMRLSIRYEVEEYVKVQDHRPIFVPQFGRYPGPTFRAYIGEDCHQIAIAHLSVCTGAFVCLDFDSKTQPARFE
jgi:hypothetical protein